MSWRLEAACYAHDEPGLWFSQARALVSEAKRICSMCPVREECLQYAVEKPEHYGVWGGMDEEERYRYRKNLHQRRSRARRREGAA